MNRFEVEGTVTKVEWRKGPRQSWYLVYIETGGGELVGVPVFEDPPGVGSRVWVTGTLYSHEGYLRLRVKKLKAAQPTKKKPSVPMVESPAA